MIRIDEIYNHTFWPFIKRNIPRTRMWFCDPPGHTRLADLKNYAPPGNEFNYIFVFDQEPLDFSRLRPVLQHIFASQDNVLKCPGHGVIITSEYNSSTVDRICQTYDWLQFYYFYNGWAALDWFRGYNYTYLVTDPSQRKITHTFIAPNRIVAGQRHHRLLMLYHIFKNQLTNNLISCPDICPAENISVVDAVEPLLQWYPDIQSVFSQQTLPLQFENEGEVSASQSSKLDLFNESSQCLLYLVTETIATGARQHLTEKVFKPICLQMPFVLVGTCGSLAYLRSYGFQTFGDFWDESYDDEPDDQKRIELIGQLLKHLDSLTPDDKTTLFHSILPVINHNYNHFYSGSFESVLWKEMQEMLDDLQTKLSI